MRQAKKFMLNAKNRQKTYPTLKLYFDHSGLFELYQMVELGRGKNKFQ